MPPLEFVKIAKPEKPKSLFAAPSAPIPDYTTESSQRDWCQHPGCKKPSDLIFAGLGYCDPHGYQRYHIEGS